MPGQAMPDPLRAFQSLLHNINRLFPSLFSASYRYGAILVSPVGIKSCQMKDGHSVSEWNLSASTAS